MNNDLNVDILAGIIHEHNCQGTPNCPRWKQDSRHWVYYMDLATLLAGKLEPVIGWEGLMVATRIILEEVS